MYACNTPDRQRLDQELLRPGEQHRIGEEGEGHQQHVPGEHVGEESDGQGERAQDDVGEELYQPDEGAHGDRHGAWP